MKSAYQVVNSLIAALPEFTPFLWRGVYRFLQCIQYSIYRGIH